MNPSTSQDALAQVQQAQATAQNPNDLLAGQRQQLGVQNAQDTVMGLRGAINNTTNLLKQVAPSVMGRTQNSLVTNAQASRQIANERAPLAQNLTDQTNQYNQSDQDLQRLEGQAQTAATGAYQGQQDKLSYLQNIYNTLYSKEKDASDAAEQARNDAENTRQFNEKLAADKASNANSGLDLSSLLGGKAPTVQDQAYTSVQKFLQGDDNQIKSDYAATLKSANYGNALDKLKVQLYKQSRPDLFGGKVPYAGGLY